MVAICCCPSIFQQFPLSSHALLSVPCFYHYIQKVLWVLQFLLSFITLFQVWLDFEFELEDWMIFRWAKGWYFPVIFRSRASCWYSFFFKSMACYLLHVSFQSLLYLILAALPDWISLVKELSLNKKSTFFQLFLFRSRITMKVHTLWSFSPLLSNILMLFSAVSFISY